MIAQPVDLAPYMATIERVQRQENERRSNHVRLSGRIIAHNADGLGDYPIGGECVTYAMMKLIQLRAAGVPEPYAVATHISGQVDGHMVVEVDGVLGGKPVHLILDSLWPWVERKEDLTPYGYEWGAP